MPKTARRALVLLTFASLLAVAACGSGDDPAAVVKWRLTVRNNTAVDYDLYMDTDLTVTDFEHIGQVAGGDEVTVSGLVTAVNYTFRLVPDGGDPDSYDFTHAVSSDGGDKSWTVP